MLVLPVVGTAQRGTLGNPVPGHRALIVSTVLAGVKGSLAALGGCAPCLFLALARWPGRATHRTEKDPSLDERRFGETCPARSPGSNMAPYVRWGSS
jgi:hypothetical protein